MDQAQFLAGVLIVSLDIVFHEESPKKTRFLSLRDIVRTRKKRVSLKIMAFNDKKSFRVEFCMEYTSSQELSEYRRTNVK